MRWDGHSDDVSLMVRKLIYLSIPTEHTFESLETYIEMSSYLTHILHVNLFNPQGKYFFLPLPWLNVSWSVVLESSAKVADDLLSKLAEDSRNTDD